MSNDTTEIHLIYTGIVALVPKYVSKIDKTITSIRILIPEGEEGGHYCWLGCVYDQVDAGNTDLDQYANPCKKELVAFKPFGDMAIMNSLAAGLDLFTTGKDHGDILQLKDADKNGKVASLDTSHLDFFVPTKLRCRTIVSSGSFDVTYLDESFKWAFHHKKNTPSAYKALAQEVCHSFKISRTDALKLKFKLNRREAFLSFKANQESVVVVIGNTPEDDILCTQSMPSALDMHVRLYNRLAKATVNDLSSLVRKSNNGPIWPSHEHGWAEDRHFRYMLTTLSPSGIKPRSVHGANCPPGWWEEEDS